MATPKSYKARFIEPGIISYDDKAQGVVLVSKDALDRMAPSFRGCPVINVAHNDASADNAFNFEEGAASPPDGIVTRVYWGDDGWQWCDFLVWDEETQRNIDELGFSVSCAYLPMDYADGGTWHEIPYDEEVTNGTYLHLAIVEQPRYEGSLIYANSKGANPMKILKLLQPKPKQNAGAEAAHPMPAPAPDDPLKPKPIQAPVAPETPVKNEVDPSTVVQLPDGSQVTLGELVEAYKSSGTGESLDMDDEVDVDGQTVRVSDLVAAWQTKGNCFGKPKKNAEDPTNDPAELPVDPTKQSRTNAAPASETKVNSALRAAAAKPGDDLGGDKQYQTREDRIARGKARYSRAVPQGAAK